MSYVVFSLAKCHLCDGDYDYEYDAEIVQELIDNPEQSEFQFEYGNEEKNSSSSS